VLVLHGEARVGKSALLDYLQEQASGFRVARAVGAESEMELAFASGAGSCPGGPAAAAAFLQRAAGLTADPSGRPIGVLAAAVVQAGAFFTSRHKEYTGRIDRPRLGDAP
jgi:hypothetical protein